MNRKDIAREIDFVDSVMKNRFCDYGEETHRALQEAVELIKQEPKTGHWIEDDKGTIICSRCSTWFSKARKEFMLYCPYCKAKMED